MQIAIFKNNDPAALEITVNTFLSSLSGTVFTIQYAPMIQEYKIATGMKMEYSVLIAYN